MKKIIQGIKNLWYWFPIIWQDRQWDHWFLVKILERKLRAMKTHFESYDNRYVSFKSRAKEIRYCRILCTRIIQDGYLTSALHYHEQIWGEAKIMLEDIPGSENSLLREIAVPHLVGKEREREKAIRNKLYDRSRRQEDQDWVELFRLMNKQIRGWWD